MASIFYRGNLQWHAQIRRRGHPAVCKTFETKAAAEVWARRVEADMDSGQFVSTKEAERYTLSECLDRYIEEYIPRLKHPEREANRARAIQKRAIAQRIMATIRATDIGKFRKEREAEGVSGNTIRLDFALLSMLFNYARANWNMESLRNPVELATKPKPGDGRDRRLEDDEEERLLAAAAPEFRPIIVFAIETAMRRSEIANLQWKNVNIRGRSVYLPETKNNEARTVPLSSTALAVLNSINPGGLVFGLLPDQITNAMQLACKHAEIKNLRFHDLRHEATSRLFEKTDLDVMEIKAITGHKTLQMLARYTHLRTANLAARLDGAKRGEVRT